MNLKIYAKTVEPSALNQIYTLAKHPVFENAQVRIMPDCHQGKGSVIGFTAQNTNGVCPNIIGVDIGCGVRVVEIGKVNVDLPALDEFIHQHIPAGMEVGTDYNQYADKMIYELHCLENLHNIDRLRVSCGSLGGGNHFIEIDEDEEGNKYLLIHTGSRNLGKQVADYYQKLAIKLLKTASIEEQLELHRMTEQYKKDGRQTEIPQMREEVRAKYREKCTLPDEQCYLKGVLADDYMHDMRICQKFAKLNRDLIAEKVIRFLNASVITEWESVHNFIDNDNIVRKGAISAYNYQPVVVPVNMRDGAIIGIGKGNPDWNYSAPHGAGRLMSRAEAKRTIALEDYEKAMEGIYSTTVNHSTIDESPFAYKDLEEIVEMVQDTIVIEKILKPIYNFKAGED